jgi:integrase
MAQIVKRKTRQGDSYIAKFSYRGREYSRAIVDGAGRPVRDEPRAKAIWSGALKRLKSGEFPFDRTITIDKWLEDYLKFMEPRNAPKTMKDKRQRLAAWRAWHRANHPRDNDLTDLQREHIEAYQGERAAACDPRTVNLDLAYLRHALEWAVDRELLERNPMARLKRLKQPHKPKKVLEPATIDKVFAELGAVAKAAWLFSADTGCRPGEMFALKWEHVDLRTRSATYTMGKTGRVKTVVFSATTAALMKALPTVKSGHVFYNRVGKPFTKDTWRATVYWAANRAKVMKWDGKRIEWGTPPNPYALRHTAASEMLKTADVATVRDAMGHGSIAVTNIYAHSDPERVKAAFERLHRRGKAPENGTEPYRPVPAENKKRQAKNA